MSDLHEGPEPAGLAVLTPEDPLRWAQSTEPLAPEIQPSRQELAPYIPNPELYIKPDLPHHGHLHGEETMIWSAVILNQGYQAVLAEHGQAAADEFAAKVDPKVLYLAASYHDCGRETDWGYHNQEMSKHGPRGAKLFAEHPDIADPTLDDSQKTAIAQLIHDHTRTAFEARAVRNGTLDSGKSYADYDDPQQLMLRLLQDADTLGLARTWYTMEFKNKMIIPIAARIRERRVEQITGVTKPGHVSRSLHFPHTAELIPAAHRLAWTDRHDPAIVQQFPKGATGAAMESAQRLGILKP